MTNENTTEVREKIRIHVQKSLVNNTNWPSPLNIEVLGHDMTVIIEKTTDQVIASGVRDKEWFINNANVENVEDCTACSECDDLCPVHYGMQCGINKLGYALARVSLEPELLDNIPFEMLYPDENGEPNRG